MNIITRGKPNPSKGTKFMWIFINHGTLSKSRNRYALSGISPGRSHSPKIGTKCKLSMGSSRSPAPRRHDQLILLDGHWSWLLIGDSVLGMSAVWLSQHQGVFSSPKEAGHRSLGWGNYEQHHTVSSDPNKPAKYGAKPHSAFPPLSKTSPNHVKRLPCATVLAPAQLCMHYTHTPWWYIYQPSPINTYKMN